MLIAARQSMLTGARPTAKDYVQDGLVAMWDGIENAGFGVHDSNATIWKDLIGGYDGTIADNNVLWDDDSLLVNGECHPCIVPAGIGTILNTKFFTIEIANKGTNRNKRGTLFGNYNLDGGQGFNIEWRYGNGTNYTYRAYFNASPDVSTTGYYLVNVKQTTTLTLDGNDLRMYHNGVIFYSNSSIKIHTPGITRYCFGSCMSRTFTFVPGYFYTMRIYSRDLTAEEIAHNYAIDKARFNLP